MSGQQYIHDVFLGRTPDRRPSSAHSNSSSLAGAMGDLNFTSRHPQPSLSRLAYDGSDWNPSSSMHFQQMHIPSQHVGFTDAGHISFPPSSSNFSYHDPNFSGHRASSTDSSPSGSGFGNDHYNAAPQTIGAVHPLVRHRSSSVSSEEQLRAEIHHLRRKVRALEAECSKNRAALETTPRSGNAAAASNTLPTPPSSSSFLSSWRARTEARRRVFCSFNRAGNALCAWHDSRRERRAYPPRNAPLGFLNCGCTHEEALFEESLARHGIGNYHPGENVRMDPALRNALLKLLKKRYAYQDGDFERDPNTGDWVEGEGPAYWEQQANSGSTSRRVRTDTDHP